MPDNGSQLKSKHVAVNKLTLVFEIVYTMHVTTVHLYFTNKCQLILFNI